MRIGRRQPTRAGVLAAGEEVGRRAEIVEQREVLVHGLDPVGTRRCRRVDRRRLSVDLDLAGVEAMHAADALDQRRLSGAVVAEDRDDLAMMHVEVDGVEREHRAEPLRRATHRQRRCHDRVTHDRAACITRNRSSRRAAHHVGLDRQHDDDADDDRLQERVDVQQVHPVADHADHQRADQRVDDGAAAAEEAGAADDHRGDRVELGQVARGRRAGVEPARGDDRGDAGQQAAQHVDRDQHRPHRDAGASGGLGIATGRVDPSTPHHAGQNTGDEQRDAGDEERRVRHPAETSELPIVVTIGGHAALGLAARQLQRETSGDAERGERDDERVRQPAPHVDAAVDEADRGAGGRA